jgi:hypothetical protein
MAIKYDLLIDQGATYTKTFTWYLPPPTPNPTKLTHGDPKDLTGYTGELQIREDLEDALPKITLSSANGGVIISGGAISLRIEASDTAAFNFSNGVYDLELTAPDGTVTRLVEGKVKVSPNVTRP